jgi:AcrR family transcriptional regulator
MKMVATHRGRNSADGGGGSGRANQKARTRRAIVDACRELMRSDRPVTMPDVAREALVSEATAYRYFPDLATLLAAAFEDDWPSPAEALEPVAESDDPEVRVAFATRFLLEGVARRQGVVRAMIAATIAHPEIVSGARPGIRFGLIRQALAPFDDRLRAVRPDLPQEVEQRLAIVVSAEALFTLTDLCRLPVDEAVARAVETARSVTRGAFAELG